jgi:glycosyltransferase involved in cell wall biosynthesis
MKLVTVVIPAFNVARTLARTLQSVVGQSHSALEIIVVDDGSTDGTSAIASEWAARDARIRVVRQANRGLSGARNRGMDEAAGEFVAPLDADDLWHPEKIARQLAAIEALPNAALAYSWFRQIDEEDRVLPGSASPIVEGWVLHRHLDRNFISNGSSPLVRTDVARAIRYDESFRSAEDYLFQLQVARKYKFACAPAYLTGYRRSTGSMSHHVERMIRSHLKMFALVRRESGAEATRIIDRRVARLEVELARNRGRRGKLGTAGLGLARGAAADFPAATVAVLDEARTAVARVRRPMFPPAAGLFQDYSADAADGEWRTAPSPHREARLAALDARGPGEF